MFSIFAITLVEVFLEIQSSASFVHNFVIEYFCLKMYLSTNKVIHFLKKCFILKNSIFDSFLPNHKIHM